MIHHVTYANARLDYFEWDKTEYYQGGLAHLRHLEDEHKQLGAPDHDGLSWDLTDRPL